MSWVLDEGFFFNQRLYNVDTGFREELVRDLKKFAVDRGDSQKVSLATLAATLWRQGYDSYERSDFAAGERFTRQSVEIWLQVLREKPHDPIYARSAAMTVYYLAFYGLSAGKDPQQFLNLERQELIHDFSWQNASHVRLAEALARLLRERSLAPQTLRELLDKRKSHEASRIIWQQLTERHPSNTRYQFEHALEHGLVGQRDRLNGDFEPARAKLVQAAKLLEPLFDEAEVGQASREHFVRFHHAAAKCSVRLEAFSDALQSFELAIRELSKPTAVKLSKADHRRAGLEKSVAKLRTLMANHDRHGSANEKNSQ
jgi:hypothetical protein